MKLDIKKGTTSKRIGVFIQDSTSTSGAGKGSLAYGDVTCKWRREDGSNADMTSATCVTMTRGTWASYGWVAMDAAAPGWYEFGVPDAALATGANWVVLQLSATGAAPLPIEIQLTSYDPYDAVRMGLTALPNAAAEAAGGLVTNGTSAGQITLSSGTVTTGALSANAITATAINADAITAAKVHSDVSDEIAAKILTTPSNKIDTDATGAVEANVTEWGGSAAPTPATVTDIWSAVTRTLTAATNITSTGSTVTIDANGNVTTADRIQKNAALANFHFVMIDSADHVSPKSGLTVSVSRALDGAVAWTATGLTVTEIGSGLYRVDLTTSETNANVFSLKFSASGADDRILTFITRD